MDLALADGDIVLCPGPDEAFQAFTQFFDEVGVPPRPESPGKSGVTLSGGLPFFAPASRDIYSELALTETSLLFCS